MVEGDKLLLHWAAYFLEIGNKYITDRAEFRRLCKQWFDKVNSYHDFRLVIISLKFLGLIPNLFKCKAKLINFIYYLGYLASSIICGICTATFPEYFAGKVGPSTMRYIILFLTFFFLFYLFIFSKLPAKT